MTRVMTAAKVLFVAAVAAHAYTVTDVTQVGDTVRCAVDGTHTLDIVPAFDNAVECCYYPNDVGRQAPTPSIDPALELTGSFTVGSLSADQVVITGPRYMVNVYKDNFSIQFTRVDGTILFESRRGDGFWEDGNASKIQAKCINGHYYGAHTRNSQIHMWGGVHPIEKGDQGRASAAFVWTHRGFGFFFDCEGGPIGFNQGEPMAGLSAQNSGDYAGRRTRLFYLIAGTPREIMHAYGTLSGSSPMPPLWSLGFQHSEWGQNQAEAMQSVHTYRDSGFGVDAFIFDFEWMAWGEDNYGEFRWNETNFPWAMSGGLKDTMDSYGINMIGIRKPRIHLNTVQGDYCENNGLFDPDAYGTDYMTRQAVGKVDFGKPEARQWWWESFVDPSYNSYERGIQAYWNDEPGYGDNFLNLHWQQANYDGHRAYDTTRVFSLNRCFYAGSQRYAYGHWSGDIKTGFEDMAKQPLEMLTSAVLGSAWWSMDIGGFTGTPSSENYFRWMQMGAFVPVYRVHCHSSQEREPWHFGQEAMTISRDFISTRYRLLDYLYAAFRRHHTEGLPPIRPLVMDYPGDAAAQTEARCWLFGDAMLVAPVVAQGATSATFHLPAGRWYSFWDDTEYTGGGDVTVACGREKIPVLVKAGAIVPQRPAAPYSTHPTGLGEIQLHVYAGDTATFTYYEDDYITYDYEQGEYCEIDLTHSFSTGLERLETGTRKGSFSPRQRAGQIVFHGVAFTPSDVARNGVPLRRVPSDHYDTAQSPCWTHRSAVEQVHVKADWPFGAGELIVSESPVRVSAVASPRLTTTPRVTMSRGMLELRYGTSAPARVRFELYDAAGRQVLCRGHVVARPGAHVLRVNESGLVPGMHLWRLVCGGMVRTGRCGTVADVLHRAR